MKNKVFVPVPVSERLPKKRGLVSTLAPEWNRLENVYSHVYFDGLKFFDQEEHSGEFAIDIDKYVTHWLEEREDRTAELVKMLKEMRDRLEWFNDKVSVGQITDLITSIEKGETNE